MRRFFCVRCADAGDTVESPRWPFPVSAVMLFAGAVLMILGAFADGLVYWGEISQGIGWLQRSGLAVGVLLLLTGTLMRVDAITLAGIATFALAATADLLGAVRNPGIGWRQMVLLVIGLALASAGSAFRARRSSGDVMVAGG